MASSDSSRVGVEPSASGDHHTTSSSYQPHHDASFCGPSNVIVNPISAVGPSDISAVGPSDVDVNTLPAVNPTESYNPVFTTVANPVANRHTLHGFEIQTLDSMFTSGTITAAIHATPNGTPYWIPQVDVRYLPVVNSTFTHWEDIVTVYNTYATQSGFFTRIGTSKNKKYKMIFVPFTGVDHHKKCVIFGAGMLYDETIESYTWLLNTFLAAHKKQPIFVLTDQDASMKQAVSTVFTNSIHRLCMWHIMRKLPSKISNDILDNTTLRSSIHKLRDTNVLFDEDYIQIIDAQRHTQRDLEFKSDMSTPRLSTGLRIEAHASETYTWSMFLEVRKEIYMGMFHCMPIERPGTTDVKNYTVRHCKSNMSYVNEFEVSLNVLEQTVSCTCLGFTRIGYLCRHVFCIFRYHQIERIPSQYIIPRWKRDALPSVVHSISNIYSSNNSEFAIIHNE
ncbi:protein FAR1-RELATED SEQUENCE 6-like [Helianthus annuus]|uniref:protein FAR1-RELATED SEQUENCE 6-like n=1 Tax=Helianthus annuus TaxID=4232 RepID=UPI000B906CD6|nr:protein FAR1-RELATED SEQUENCE 6-like [Helianthus annuus]